MFGFDHFGRGVLYETFVRQFFQNGGEKSFLVGEVGLQLLEFFFHIDAAAQRDEIFGRFDDERGCVGTLFGDLLHAVQVRHFLQQRVVFAMIIVVPDDVQFQRFLVRNVVLLADVPHGRDGLFELFDAFEQRLVERLRCGQRGDRFRRLCAEPCAARFPR